MRKRSHSMAFTLRNGLHCTEPVCEFFLDGKGDLQLPIELH